MDSTTESIPLSDDDRSAVRLRLPTPPRLAKDLALLALAVAGVTLLDALAMGFVTLPRRP